MATKSNPTAKSNLASLVNLSAITSPKPIADLDTASMKELQFALGRLGYPVGEADGLYGPRTRSAWGEFKADVFPGHPDLIGPESVGVIKEHMLAVPSAGKVDFSTKEGTIAAITAECKAQGIGLRTQIAYVLATTQWETARTFKPVKEAFWLSEDWRKKNLRYYPYYGRGYVQLTWDYNYKKYSGLLGVDMLHDPDLALEPKYALFVLVHGFKTGTFTGQKITNYITETATDFRNARRCINGIDHAQDIADIAQSYL